VLLADGRVVSAGDDYDGTGGPGTGLSQDTLEIYSPPYLFRGARPTVAWAPGAVRWNTAFGVASVRREWLNVAKTLEMPAWRTALRVILPAAAPTILTGMRISIGIAWLVIVAAEMLVGGTGIGYFVWNEWNNLSITNVITAILVIGLVGMVLDQILARFARLVTFPE